MSYSTHTHYPYRRKLSNFSVTWNLSPSSTFKRHFTKEWLHTKTVGSSLSLPIADRKFGTSLLWDTVTVQATCNGTRTRFSNLTRSTQNVILTTSSFSLKLTKITSVIYDTS